MALAATGPAAIPLAANGDGMTWQEQQIAELRSRIAAHLQRRGELEGTRLSPAGAAVAADQIRRIDGEISETARALADAERKMKDGR
jgi:hypothetical protein